MAFDTYANLQTAILDRLNRSDLTSPVVDWITIAENDINRWLRVNWNEKRSYATPTSAFVELPSDFNGLRNLQWDYQNYRMSLRQVSPDLIDKMYPATTAGIPEYFCVHSDQLELRPAPDATNSSTVEIIYWFKPAALSDANTSNEILVNAPELLFYRALAEGWKHIHNTQEAAVCLSVYERYKKEIMEQDAKLKWSGNPIRSVPDSIRMMYS